MIQEIEREIKELDKEIQSTLSPEARKELNNIRIGFIQELIKIQKETR